MAEGADRRERTLAAENARLRKALEKIAATQERSDALGPAYDAPALSAETANRVAADALAEAGWRPTIRHKKRGTSYMIESGTVTLQTDVPLHDGAELLTYRGQDGRRWGRTPAEMGDGRFESFLTAPAKEPGHG